VTIPATPHTATPAVDSRIIDIILDSQSLTTRASSDAEIERHKAISDLLAQNTFRLTDAAAPGPYKVMLLIDDGRLVIRTACTRSGHKTDIRLPLSALKRHIADYAILCDNFYKTAREGQIHRLEAIDAGRRSIHDEAAEILAESIENTVIVDKMTARRLFTLVYVLHIRNHSTF
jgi:uncharacterized protein (UPF0262 family)